MLVCRWLVLNGALNRLSTEGDSVEEGEGENGGGTVTVAVEHVDPSVVQRDTTPLQSWISHFYQFFE